VTRWFAHVAGQIERNWTLEDFHLATGRSDSLEDDRDEDEDGGDEDWGEDDDEDEDEGWDEGGWEEDTDGYVASAPDPGREKLHDLSVAFLGYVRREEGIPYSKGELGRARIVDYLLKRYSGELEPRRGGPKVASGRRKRGEKREPPGAYHPLCPDPVTLDAFLAPLIGVVYLGDYKAAAAFELIPAWLRFLESRRLIDGEQHAKTLSEIRPLCGAMIGLFEKDREDPTLARGIQKAWPEEV
jgi:hypothetical protein